MIKVFFSYAREDADLLDNLVDRHMGPLIRAGRIEPWVDRRELRAGHEWQERMGAIADADLIVLLLTSSFFGSDFIANVELERALHRWKRGEVEVVPVLVKRVTKYNLGVLEKLQIVPDPDKPIHRGGRTEAEIDDDGSVSPRRSSGSSMSCRALEESPIRRPAPCGSTIEGCRTAAASAVRADPRTGTGTCGRPGGQSATGGSSGRARSIGHSPGRTPCVAHSLLPTTR